MNYQRYKNMIKNKFFACVLMFGLTAVVAQAQLTIGVASTGGGHVELVSAPGTPIYSVTTSGIYVPSAEIQAVADTGKVFSYWEYIDPADDTSINIYPDIETDTITLAALTTDSIAVRAVFVNSPFTVTVTSEADDGTPAGSPEVKDVDTGFVYDDINGVYDIPEDTEIYVGVKSPSPGNTGIRYKCTASDGFTGTGDFASGTSTNTTATITQASTITWHWSTQYQLTLGTSTGGGSTVGVTPDISDRWYDDGTSIELTAQPASGYNFLRWENLGGPVHGNTNVTVTFSIDAPQEVIAVFEAYPQLSLDIISESPIDGSPIAGYSYLGDTSRYHTYNTLIDMTVQPTVLANSGRIREHCMGYTSTGGDVSPSTITDTEISSITPFAITANSTITLDWEREYRVKLGVAGTDTNGFSVSFSSYTPNRTFTSPPWFRNGDVVSISAVPLTTGYVFLQWDTSVFGINQYSHTNTFTVTGSADINARFASEDLDSDLDGMPDTWEAEYGLNEGSSANAYEDPDNDGLSNLQEYYICVELDLLGIARVSNPIDADSDGDGMIDGYEYDRIVNPTVVTPVGQSENLLAVVYDTGYYGRTGNPDGDYHWNTDNGYEDYSEGLVNYEEYIGPDDVDPYDIVDVNDSSLSSKTIYQAQINPDDSGDTSYSDTTDSEQTGISVLGEETYGDGFDDGFEYSWDQWQGAHAGMDVRDPLEHVVPNRFGTPAMPLATVNADIDGDGNQDLITACYEQGLVSVLFGNGSSNFESRQTFRLDTNIITPVNKPVDLVAADFNADGFIDVITVNDNGSYSVLFNSGSVSSLFPVIDTYSIGTSTSFVKIDSADLDGLQGPDLVLAAPNDTLYVALNDGLGDFSAMTSIGLSASPADIKLAPFYSSSTSTVYDLAVTLDNTQVEIFANDGLGGFTSTSTISLTGGANPQAFDVGDFDGNGFLDIAVLSSDKYVRIFLNDGVGTFTISNIFLVQQGSTLVDVAAGDFTSYNSFNGDIDLAIISISPNQTSVSLYPGTGLGTFGYSNSLSTEGGPVCVLLAELRASYLDMVVVQSLADSLIEFVNDGAGNFSGYGQFDASDNTVSRRFNPAVMHIPEDEDVYGRADYDLVYYIETGRAVEWYSDYYEYNASSLITIGNYTIPAIVGDYVLGTTRRSSHPFLWDADGDSLPDGWEVAYGYDPWYASTFGVNDGTANPDGDWFAVQYDNAGNVTAKNKEIYDAEGFNPKTGFYYMPPVDLNNLGPNTAQFVNYQELLGSSYMPAVMPNDPNDGGTCPISLDADSDGVWDGWELYVGMDPTSDTDAGEYWDVLNIYPWLPNGQDGLPNGSEFASYATSTNELSLLYPVDGWYNKTYPTDPYDADTDWDQVYDGAEQGYFNFSASVNGGGLCPTAVDTDGDRLPDSWEAFFTGAGDTNSWAGGMNGTAHDAYLDYDNDGLVNYQEYFTGANYGWRYDIPDPISGEYNRNAGAGAYDPYDFFLEVSEGGFGRLPKEWDPSYFLNPPVNSVNLRYVLASETLRASSGPYWQTSNPADMDSDTDGMNDYWEVFHGLNPLYGRNDLVSDADVNPLTIWHSDRDYNLTPWIVGYPDFDVDQDGISNYDEGIFENALDFSHTDPSSLWMTDTSAGLSYVNLYFWTGTFYANSEWYWGDDTYGGTVTDPDTLLDTVLLASDNSVIDGSAIAPVYAYSFEINEGYDTDNDGISDRAEINDSTVSPGITDPLDNMSPKINRALYLNGEAYAETPAQYGWSYPDYRTYTVEAWVRPEELPTTKKQVIMQRGGYLSNGDQFDPAIFGWRRNFELGLTEDGKPYLLFDTPIGDTYECVANFAVDADQWYHLSGSYEAEYNSSSLLVGNLKLYLDGILVKSLPVSSAPANSYQGGSVELLGTMTFTVGNGYQESDPNTYYFKGWVDNVRAWGAYQDQDTIQSNMSTTFDRAEATTYATNAATRLLYSFSFNDLPDPNIDNITPEGFDALVGYPANYTSIPFWRSMTDRSKVYNDYLYLPWIDNQSLHYPRPVASDTVISNIVYGTSTTPPENYPNTSDPYGFKYLTATTEGGPSYESVIHPDTLANTSMEADMLPMLYATATESVDMWDDIAARSIDSDGDGMPDLWEEAMGLDPNDATGVNGAYGDYDNDGLSNYYEYEAGTSPIEFASTTNDVPDFFAWGNNLTGALNHDYRTFGELLTDHDLMEDDWEVSNGLSPYLFDAFQDADGDGWCNYNEFRYGSDPQSQGSTPLSWLNFRFKFLGDATLLSSGVNLLICSYSDLTEAPDCMMEYTIGEEVEYLGGYTSGYLNSWPTASSVIFYATDGSVYYDDGSGNLTYGTTTNVFGYVDYATGYWNTTFNALYAEYQTAEAITYPVSGSAGDMFWITAGTLHSRYREGLNHFFVFADLDDNRFWDPTTEPAGTVDNGAIMLNGSTPELMDVSLKYYAPGFGRFAWTPVDDVVGYRLNVSKGSTYLFSEELGPKKCFINEDDFMEFYGNALPAGTIKWSVDIITQSGSYSNDYATGTFDIGYYSSLETPTIVSPNTGVKCSTFRQTFKWENADKDAAFYELQVATDSAFSDVVLSKTGYTPIEYADHYQITLPEIGSGFEWEQQTYYWRVRSKNHDTIGAWSTVESFRIDYDSDDSDTVATHAIEGTVYYTGKAKTGNIVVEAYDNDSFSGVPLSIDVIVNDPVPEAWPLNSYSYKLPGLPDDTYYVRAFLDQNSNYIKDDFETYGYMAESSDFYTVGSIDLTSFGGDVTGQDIYTVVADTDNDMLADDWEWSYLATLTVVGAGEVRGFTDYDGNGVNDFEAYAWSALNMSPLDGSTSGTDNIPYALKSDFGLCVTEDIDFSLKGIDIDKYGNLNISWNGFGGTSGITLSNDNGSKALSVTAGDSTVQYTLQYSTDMNSWIDVETGNASSYDDSSDMFMYTGEAPSVSAIENNEPIFFRFKVEW